MTKRTFAARIIAIMLLIAMMMTFSACVKPGNGGGDVTLDPGGNVRPSGDGVTVVKFWGWGDEGETEAFTQIVNNFNKKYEGVIRVEYTQRPATTYGETLLTVLAGKNGPDVFYASDNFFKQYATMGYLLDITEYYNNGLTLRENDVFPNTISRFRYDVETTTSNSDDPLLALPKNLAPTAIFYNVTQFKEAGVQIISMTEEEALAAGYTVRGYDPVAKVFNNKVAMSWEDCVLLSQHLMDTGASDYGFFSEWWFNYAWSVGGDCVEYVETTDPAYNGGRYMFTLNDSSKNYIVKDDFAGTLTVNGTSYKAGELISYTDKSHLTDADKANCNELPSQREAFTEFVRLSQPKSQVVDNVTGVYANTSDFYGADANGDLKGYGITPSPSAISSDGKVGYFTSGKIGMLFNTLATIGLIQDNMTDEWDVAPALVYKEYSEDGKEVLVHGVEAAHSVTTAICINKKTTVAQAAYLFAEYITSEEAQMVQVQAGMSVPLQKDLANSEAFLNSDKNLQVFIDAAYSQTPGDWWYLRDKKWIDDWSNVLNGDVRNGDMTLTQFYSDPKFIKTQSLLDEYTKK